MDNKNKKRFCPNCGQPVTAGEQFCGNCGYAFKQQPVNTKTATRATQATAVTAVKRPPMKTANKWLLGVVAVVAVLLIGGYMFGSNYYSKEKQLDRAITAIRKNSKDDADYFTTSDVNLKLNHAKLQPMVTYMQQNKEALADLKTQLGSVSATTYDGDFTFKQSGKAWLVFDRYKIAIKAVYPKVTTNRDHTAIYLNGKKAYTANATTAKSLGPLVPGTYKLKATAIVNKQQLSNAGTYHITSNNRNFALPIKTISFEALGYPDATVQINGKNEGVIGSAGELSLVDLPWSSNMRLTETYKSTAGTLTSKVRHITEADADSSVKVAYPGVISHVNADSMIQSIFYGVDTISSTGELPGDYGADDQSLSSYFVGGAANTEYNALVAMAKGYYKDDTITGVSYDTDVKHVYPYKRNQATVVYRVTFTFDNQSNDDDSDAGQHVQVFEYKAIVEKSGTGYKITSIAPSTKISDEHIGGTSDSDTDSSDD
ncbi:zinc ribbon domain-containing protein [Loigolactobacillus binensis]|uniref:Zinc ribbon domain-containing protein n=1 Tax=Loigolactobacillus binensis TaxID=2559922 RepID=A0ABW3EG73_9LACO|nr:zinc ribbon domain-containing protein [Loigolactobacillus binensis]